jgi:hypothetical protein
MTIGKRNFTSGVISTALLAGVLCLTPVASADQVNKMTEVTFSAPVEIPGMVLPAGKYVFKVLDSSVPNRNVVQIFNAENNHLLATILAITDYRMEPSGKTVITFEERASGAPEAIHEWFYPGDDYGSEFVYPKARAVALANRTNRPVLAMPSEMASNISKPAETPEAPSVTEMKQATVAAVTPQAQPIETAQAAPAAPPAPTEATAMPLVALVGLGSFGAALGIRLFSKRLA